MKTKNRIAINTTELAEEYLADDDRRRRIERSELAVNSVVGAEILGVSRETFQEAKKFAGIRRRRCFISQVLPVLLSKDFACRSNAPAAASKE